MFILSNTFDGRCTRLVAENYETLQREVKENLYRWREISCSRVEKLNINVSSFQIDRFDTIPIKIQVSFIF